MANAESPSKTYAEAEIAAVNEQGLPWEAFVAAVKASVAQFPNATFREERENNRVVIGTLMAKVWQKG